MRKDDWGWRARFGILVTHKDAVPEAELWAMAPLGVTIHTARFESPRRPGSDYSGDPAALVADSPDVARGLDFLGQMRLDAICICFGSSSFFGGYGFDDDLAAMATAKGHGIPVTTAALAMVAALRATDVTSPLLVLPPWFPESVADAARSYFDAAGFKVRGPLRFDLGQGWREMQPYEVYDRGGQWDVRPDEVYQQVRRGFPADADGVLIPGSGFRSLDAIEPLEQDLGVPVITSNQASLWHCLEIAKVSVSAAGRGWLLTRRVGVLANHATPGGAP